MKKYLAIIILTTFTILVNAQNLQVKNIVKLQYDVQAKVNPQIDSNGEKCALVRLNIPSIQNVDFLSPIVGEPIYMPGEYSVYISADSKSLCFICDNQNITINFSDFDIQLEPMCCYRAVVGKSVSQQDINSVKFSVVANFENDVLLIDGYPVGQLPAFLDDVKVGNHIFAVPNTMGRILRDTVIMITEYTKNISLNLKEEPQSIESVDFMGEWGEGWELTFDEPDWVGIKRVSSNGKWGLVDRAGIIVPYIYDMIGDVFITSEYIQVANNGGWGLIDKTGKELIPCVYDWIEDPRYIYEGYVIVKRQGRSGLFKLGHGEVWFGDKAYDHWYYIGGGLFGFGEKIYTRDCGAGERMVSASKIINVNWPQFLNSVAYKTIEWHRDIDSNVFYIAEDSQGYYYILDEKGSMLISVHSIYRGDDVEILFDYQTRTGVWGKNNKYEFFNIDGDRKSLPSRYDVQSMCLFHGLLAVKDRETKKVGFINTNNSIIIPFRYSWPESVLARNDMQFSEDGLVELKDNDGYSYIFNTKGEILLQTKPGFSNSYKEFEKHDDYIKCISYEGNEIYINHEGSVIVPYSRNDYYYEYGFSNGEISRVGNNGKLIVPKGKYKSCEFSTKDAFFIFTDNHMLGYDLAGDLVVDIPFYTHNTPNGYNEGYQMATSDNYGNDRFALRDGNRIIQNTKDIRLFQVINTTTQKCGYISATGELLTSCIYDRYNNYFGYDDENEYSLTINTWVASEGYGIICLGGRFGFIDTAGKVVVPLIYSFVTPFVNGVSYVKDMSNNWSKIYSKDLQ